MSNNTLLPRLEELVEPLVQELIRRPLQDRPGADREDRKTGRDGGQHENGSVGAHVSRSPLARGLHDIARQVTGLANPRSVSGVTRTGVVTVVPRRQAAGASLERALITLSIASPPRASVRLAISFSTNRIRSGCGSP